MSTKIEINKEIVKQIFSRESIKIYYDKDDDEFWYKKWFHSKDFYFIGDMSKFKVKECSNCKYFSICMIIEYKGKFYNNKCNCEYIKKENEYIDV